MELVSVYKLYITKLKSKIHRAKVTSAELDYVGSITIDEDLMKKANISEYEKVHIVNVNNGQRFETYVIAGQPGSGVICLNGAAARCACVNDVVIIMAYVLLSEDEDKNFLPQVVFVNEDNEVTSIKNYEKHGQLS